MLTIANSLLEVLENICQNTNSKNIKDILRNMKDSDSYGAFSSKNFFFYPLQSHRTWEVAIQIEGESVIELQSRRYVVKEGQVFLIPPTFLHKLGLKMVRENSSKILWIMVTTDSIFPSLSTYHDGKREKEWATEISAPGSYLLNEIRDEMKHGPRRCQEPVATYLASFLMLVTRKLHFTEKVWGNAKRTAMVLKVKNYINENAEKRITLDELAEMVSVSKNYLSTVFKNATGGTITQYILETKSHKAITYLLETDKKLSEISEAIGFCDQFHFSKVFKEVIGIPPAEYRKTYGREKNL